MKKWSIDALNALKADFKLKINMNHGLSDKLEIAAGGFMTAREAQAVLSRPSNAEQMEELLRILCGKREADFTTFCKMLRKSNNSVWADTLEGKAREFREQGTFYCGIREWCMYSSQFYISHYLRIERMHAL